MGAEDEGGGAGEGNAGMVPSSRLREETAAKRSALERLAAAEAEVATWKQKAGAVETLTKQVTDLQAELEGTRAAFDDERAVYRTGVTDPEAVEIARHLHARLPEKDRPKFSAWFEAQAKEPGKAPKALAAYLQPPAAGAGTGEKPPPRQMGAKRETAAASTTDGAGGAMTAEQARARIAQLTAEAERTGDWETYKKERPALLARLAGPRA